MIIQLSASVDSSVLNWVGHKGRTLLFQSFKSQSIGRAMLFLAALGQGFC